MKYYSGLDCFSISLNSLYTCIHDICCFVDRKEALFYFSFFFSVERDGESIEMHENGIS